MRLYVRTSRDTKCEQGAGGVCTCDADARCGPATGDRGCLCVAGVYRRIAYVSFMGGDSRPTPFFQDYRITRIK